MLATCVAKGVFFTNIVLFTIIEFSVSASSAIPVSGRWFPIASEAATGYLRAKEMLKKLRS